MERPIKITVELDMLEYTIVVAALNKSLDGRLNDINQEAKERQENVINIYQRLKDKLMDAYIQEISK